jgi:hypothetical protein
MSASRLTETTRLLAEKSGVLSAADITTQKMNIEMGSRSAVPQHKSPVLPTAARQRSPEKTNDVV